MLLVLGALGGCAHAPPRVAVAEAPTPPAAPAPSPPTDLSAWAARFGNALACEREARRAPAAARLPSLRACVTRPDFTDAAVLLRTPWPELLRAQGVDGVDLLARVLARRGFDWAVDVDVATDLGLPVAALEPRGRASYAASATQRPWALLRARLVRQKVSAPTLVGETAVLRSHKKARADRYGYVQAPVVTREDRALLGFHEWGPSGVELRVTRGQERCRDAGDSAVLALVRVVRLTPVPPQLPDGAETGQYEGEAELVRCYPASDRS